jgi:hypothetical protein
MFKEKAAPEEMASGYLLYCFWLSDYYIWKVCVCVCVCVCVSMYDQFQALWLVGTWSRSVNRKLWHPSEHHWHNPQNMASYNPRNLSCYNQSIQCEPFVPISLYWQLNFRISNFLEKWETMLSFILYFNPRGSSFPGLRMLGIN